jgi:hypothetical protein
MTQETPARVFSLLGVALTSMFFLFAVTVTNANFSQTEKPFPAVFNPDNVMAVLDNVSSSYSRFVDVNLIQPAKQDYAFYADNVSYIMDEASPSILAFTGLTGLAEASSSLPEQAQPQVAGAYTQSYDTGYSSIVEGFNVDTLYSVLMMQ